METTYRAEGFSIGQNYMRYEGATISPAISPTDLQIEATVGRGACSIVKRARHLSSMEPFALKIFPIRCSSKRDMLVKELRALCKLQCDCLVGLIGAFFDKDDDPSVTMVLEYMDRGSLEDMLAEKPKIGGIEGKAVASIAFQVLWGLAYLHHEKLCHRDIKPANVLVNSAGQVKLSDFGIASQHVDEKEMNVTVVGTTRYMSLERLRAKPYGLSSDIWSFGLVILECCTGHSPFDDLNSVVELVLTLQDTSAREMIPSTIGAGLRELLRACLQKYPEKRVPANVLIYSPWFANQEIYNLTDAVEATREFIEFKYGHQKSSLLSSFALESLKQVPYD